LWPKTKVLPGRRDTKIALAANKCHPNLAQAGQPSNQSWLFHIQGGCAPLFPRKLVIAGLLVEKCKNYKMKEHARFALAA